MGYKNGSYWSRNSYGTVVDTGKKRGLGVLCIENEDGFRWDITKDIVDKEFAFNDQYTDEQKVTRTEIIKVFNNNARVIMTVNFNKKLDDKEFTKKLKDLYPNKGKVASRAAYELSIEELVGDHFVGEERTMIGRHYGNADDFGRTRFIDMEQDRDMSKVYDSRQRLVDPRTINWLIVDGTKYMRK